jgi:NAD(P)-dependent dehydrogenase (short-subunit alcohol dehydrogenase family)
MPDPEKEDSRDTVNLKVLERCFAINTYGPFLLTQALLPNVLVAPEPRRIAVVSSRVGSIADNTSGGLYAYRASKCAVNNLFKTLAVELKEKGVIVTMLHPGFTNTNLSPGIAKVPGVVEPEVSALGLWKVVQSTKLEDTGKFWHREGTELPW